MDRRRLSQPARVSQIEAMLKDPVYYVARIIKYISPRTQASLDY
jgi:hypothetical protein